MSVKLDEDCHRFNKVESDRSKNATAATTTHAMHYFLHKDAQIERQLVIISFSYPWKMVQAEGQPTKEHMHVQQQEECHSLAMYTEHTNLCIIEWEIHLFPWTSD